MKNSIPRDILIKEMEELINKLLEILREKNDQDKPIFNNNDYHGHQRSSQSTVEQTTTLRAELEQFKQEFEKAKFSLLLVPLEKKEFQEYLQKQSELPKSKVSASYVNSFINFNNSDIDRQKAEDIKQQLYNFVQNQQQNNQLTCETHKKRIEFLNLSNDPNIQNRTLCSSCPKGGIKLSEFLEQYLINFFEFKTNSEKKGSIINKQIQDLSNLLLQKKNINQLYSDLNISLQSRIEIIDRIAGSQLNNFNYLNHMAQDYVKTQAIFLKWKQEFDEKLQAKLKEDFEDVQVQIQSNIQNREDEKLKISQSIQNQQYKLLNTIQQPQICQVLTFNRNDELIATAKNNVIVIWSFYKGQMKYITELKGHQKEISCLLFDQNTEVLISAGGDGDGLLNLWKYLGNNQWMLQNKIENTVGIKVIVFDSNKKYLIVGCQKGKIKIFQYYPEIPFIEFEQEIELDSKQAIFGLTLNNSKTTIVSLEQFKQEFEKAKFSLLLVPLEKKEFQEYLQKQSELPKSKVSASYVNSFINFNNSDIDRQKAEDIKQQLYNFVQNQQQNNQLTCETHKKRIEFLNLSNDPNIQNRTLCSSCPKGGIKLSEFLEQYLINFFEFKTNSEKKGSIINKQIQDLSNLLLQKKNINQLYSDLNISLQSRIEIIDRIAGSQLNNFNYLNHMAQDYVKTQAIFLKWKQEFDEKLQAKLKEDFEDVQVQIQSNIQNREDEKLKISQSIQNQQYKLLNTIQQPQICQVLTFNRNDELIATAKNNVIVIWSFYKGQMKYITELKGHQKEISCLLFDQNTEVLISAGGDGDGLLNLWKYLGNNQWMLQNKIENTVGIKVIVFDSNKKYLIVGCQKGKIKIFQYYPEIPFIEFEQEIELDSKQAIFGLTLNNSKTTIVSCGADMVLRIHLLDSKFKCINQRGCDSAGIRVQFIDEQSFVLVQKNGWLIYYQIEWQTIKEIQKISLSSENRDYIYSPIYYNSVKRLLIVKHYRTIHFLRRLNNGTFEKITYLKYQSNILYATISNDGNYLVTWIDQEKEQKIEDQRILQYQIYGLQF
ncbi:unnamed protein product [Paramecium pentaurelia]|uniref:WD40-repeat-containing domain n=1 Tax=Paramecium pentaurelia TaxID=43138 RepID=A0A8S1VD63_9CILI|nr:unnamed protein product [Paramecium pentaurelia]